MVQNLWTFEIKKDVKSHKKCVKNEKKKKKLIATALKFVRKDCKSGVSQEIFLDKKAKNGPSELSPTSFLWLKRTWCWKGQF